MAKIEMNEEPPDPLADLLLDQGEVDRTLLAGALKSLLGVDTDTGRLVLRPGFNDLSARRRVLAFLLGRKAALLLGKLSREEAGPTDIAKEAGIPRGTVAPKLRELHEDRVISRNKGGQYYVDHHQVHAAVDELRSEMDDR